LLTAEDLSWPQASHTETAQAQQYTFDTPKELFEYIEECGRNQDYHNYGGPLTEEAFNGFAGVLLQSATMIDKFSPLAAVAENSPDAAAMIEILKLLQRSMRPDPPAAAVAQKQLTESMFLRTPGTSAHWHVRSRSLSKAANVIACS
jgi:hypothetical protein